MTDKIIPICPNCRGKRIKLFTQDYSPEGIRLMSCADCHEVIEENVVFEFSKKMAVKDAE
ncbi:hypothetical protein FH968_02095 [Buttiauxella sp. B2]|nr:hypothetical protein FH968_02095 [Buttiauxella sp. B2]